MTLWVFGILAMTTGCSTENTPVAEKVATAAAKLWLHKVDVDSLAFAYDEAGMLLRERRTKADWVENVRDARTQMGQVVDRQLATRRYEDDPPLYTEGAYVIVSFDTDFTEEQDVEELVVMRLNEGVWRPERYILNPAP
jgi:hypothetical protein